MAVSKFIEKLQNKLYFNQSIWSISICENESPINNSYKNIQYPVLTYKDVTDRKAQFVADPFIIKENDKWYMFFEIYDDIKKIGIIGLATSDDKFNWKYEKVVLEESFHLSYPYVFKYNNKIYMMPETGESGFIKIYEAINFPYEWRLTKDIIKGNYWDASLFRHNDLWWINTYSNRPYRNSMSLFYAKDLFGDWKEHKMSPIVQNNPQICRPAGRVIKYDNKLIRFAQDRSDYYGKQIIALRISKLTADEYEENEIGVVASGCSKKNKWNKDGMHTIDAHQLDNNKWLMAVDGHYFKKINKIMARLKG